MSVLIEKLVSDAYGLSHDDEGVLLIRDALPGEEVEFEVTGKKGGTRVAIQKGVYRDSPIRIEPICPLYGHCGGCNFQIVNEVNSAILKEEIVKDALRRIGRIDFIPEFDEPVYGEFVGHRSRCRFHIDIKTKSVGFLEEGSNSLVPLEYCPALDEALNSLISDKKRLFDAARKKILEGDKKTGKKYVELDALSNGKDVSLGGNIVFDLLGREIIASSRLFFQSNRRLLPSLMEYIKENTIGDAIMDLYSGVGTFSSMFECEGKTLFAVERDKEALRYMQKNAPSAIVFAEDVAKWGRKSGRKPDTVIVDPPRVGLGEEVSRLLSSWNAERIIYASCSPSTMARDISFMDGYKIERIRVFDFYPGTGHVETVTSLSKR